MAGIILVISRRNCQSARSRRRSLSTRTKFQVKSEGIEARQNDGIGFSRPGLGIRNMSAPDLSLKEHCLLHMTACTWLRETYQP